MPLLLLLIGLGFPRVVIFVLWFFTGWFTTTTDWIIGILGFLFMPYTLLWYSVVMNWYSGIFGFWQMLILFIAVMIDLSQIFVGRWYYSD